MEKQRLLELAGVQLNESYPSDDAYDEALKTVAKWLVNAAMRDEGDGGREAKDILEDYTSDTFSELQKLIQSEANFRT